MTKEEKIKSSLSILKVIIYLDAIDDEFIMLGHAFKKEPKQFINNTKAGILRRFGEMTESLFEIDFKNDTTHLEDIKDKINELIEGSVNVI